MSLQTVEAIEEYIVTYIERELHISSSEIDCDMSLGAFGMSSKSGLKLVGLLEDRLDIRIDPKLIFAHPTISRLSSALLDLLQK
ncbi:acyl carrier protein [Methylosinus sp. Ce-a6]|uniref:acyl carrier protein n=1 Tax=Methylosinus sp. Ce-a6 TaxID=2172005 RepID=UPI001FCEB4B6|nr:acyl carrier protein [Methylosinus sp. Ce-a6]